MTDGLFRNDHPETSRDAAKKIGGAKRELHARIVDALRGTDGLTDEAMQMRLEMNPNTQRPRRIELWRMGVVEDSGATRPTRSGRAAIVWRLKS